MVISSPSKGIYISEIDDKTSQSSIRVAFRNIAYKFGSNTTKASRKYKCRLPTPFLSVPHQNRVHLRFLQKFFNYVLLQYQVPPYSSNHCHVSFAFLSVHDIFNVDRFGTNSTEITIALILRFFKQIIRVYIAYNLIKWILIDHNFE
jgi:hypothetical protein